MSDAAPLSASASASSSPTSLLHARAATLANLLAHLAAAAPAPAHAAADGPSSSPPSSPPSSQDASDAPPHSPPPSSTDAADLSNPPPPPPPPSVVVALPDGLDVLLAEIVVIAEKVKEEHEELVEKLRVSRDTQDELALDFRTLQGKLHAVQEKVENSLNATATAEAALATKVVETEGLKREARVLNRERDELRRRLEAERQATEKLKLEWAEKEARYAQSIRSQKRANEDLKTETKLKDQQLQEALVVDDTGNAELHAAKSEAKSMEEKLTVSLQQLAEVQLDNDLLTKKVGALEDERLQLRNELAELQEQVTALAEENESYQLLLQQQTLTGEFMASSIMKGDKRSSLAQASSEAMKKSLFEELDGSSGQAARAAANALVEENQRLQNEITALTSYINKVLNDARLLDALSQLHDTGSRPSWPFDGPRGVAPPGSTAPYRAPTSSSRTASGLRAASTSGGSAAVAAAGTLSPTTAAAAPGMARTTSFKARAGGGGGGGAGGTKGSFSVSRRAPLPIVTMSAASAAAAAAAPEGGEAMTLISVDVSGGSPPAAAPAATPTAAAATSWSGYLKRGLDTIVGALSPQVLDDGARKELPDVSGGGGGVSPPVKKDSL
ncbi:hypothetical protein DFJ73DRAFT_796220 [Zopfochytrium polystomum]|nr:hypothetical protein DFJ73DRAFT_796220 [Zopfochytrium polystomum]